MSPFPRCLSKYWIETATDHLETSRPSMSVEEGYICAPGSGAEPPAAGVVFRCCNVRPSAVIMRRRRFSLTVHSGCSESRRAWSFATPSVGCWVLRDWTVDLRASSGGEIGVVVDISHSTRAQSIKLFPSQSSITLPDLVATITTQHLSFRTDL
jgi:hypothetical protein